MLAPIWFLFGPFVSGVLPVWWWFFSWAPALLSWFWQLGGWSLLAFPLVAVRLLWEPVLLAFLRLLAAPFRWSVTPFEVLGALSWAVFGRWGLGLAIFTGGLARVVFLVCFGFLGNVWAVWSFLLVGCPLVLGAFLFGWLLLSLPAAARGVVWRAHLALKLLRCVIVLSWEWFVLFGELPGLFRHLRAPRPPVLPVEVKKGKSNLPLAFLQAPALGQSWAQAENLAHVSASGAVMVPRFRPRGRLTRRLQQVLEVPFGRAGSFLRGRWTPDLPSHSRSPVLNALLSCRKDGAKLLGVGAVQTADPGDGLYVVVETAQRERELVFPALWARLSRYACMRERTPELLHGVRARAAQWFKEVGVPGWVVPLALPSACVAAVMESVPELEAKLRLRAAGLDTLLS